MALAKQSLIILYVYVSFSGHIQVLHESSMYHYNTPLTHKQAIISYYFPFIRLIRIFSYLSSNENILISLIKVLT